MVKKRDDGGGGEVLMVKKGVDRGGGLNVKKRKWKEKWGV